MAERESFWRLGHLSDRQLLERLQGVLCRQRYALAELIAHLAEVEERRLHLATAHGSLFSYCVGQLGMSEDEACRRIELARLARRFPLLFGELASGRIGLSVALLLKPVLTSSNHAELIASARGASLRTARELLAARFPSPDVPSRIRKLPERPVADATLGAVGGVVSAMATGANLVHSIPPGASTPVAVASLADVSGAIPTAAAEVRRLHLTSPGGTIGSATSASASSSPLPSRSPEIELGSLAGARGQGSSQDSPTPSDPSLAPARVGLLRHPDPRQRQRIDPLSAERYRIVFTSDTSLKQKLERARDLLRHANPGGDLAPIVSRALDLLLQELLQRRFGARRKDTPHRAARAASPAPPAAPAPTTAKPPAMAPPIATAPSSALPIAEPVPPPLTTSSAGTPLAAGPPMPTPLSKSASRIARPARRAVLERDGLGCAWVDATGERCGSTAWLELDHQHPRGKGGDSAPANLRLLCRAHNRFAAECAYGREHVERAIQARQGRAKRRRQNGQPPSSSPAPA